MVAVVMGGVYRYGVSSGNNGKVMGWLVAIIHIQYLSDTCLNMIIVANPM